MSDIGIYIVIFVIVVILVVVYISGLRARAAKLGQFIEENSSAAAANHNVTDAEKNELTEKLAKIFLGKPRRVVPPPMLPNALGRFDKSYRRPQAQRHAIFDGLDAPIITRTHIGSAERPRCSPENIGTCAEKSLAKNSILVVDGQNVLYNLLHKHVELHKMPYEQLIIHVVKLLRKAFPTSSIHFVIKPYLAFRWEAAQKALKDKKVSLHVAQTSTPATSKRGHYQKAADDILCLLLASQFANTISKKVGTASNIILLSNDLFRDIRDFKKTAPFVYTAINNGKIKEETIDPQTLNVKHPLLHFGFRFLDAEEQKKHEILNGAICRDTMYAQEQRKCVFLYSQV